MRDIKDLTLEELEKVFIQQQEPEFYARQAFNWIYKKGIRNFEEMTDLSLKIRKYLKENFYIYGFRLMRSEKSSDGTQKLLFALKDNNLIEAVIIPADKRITGCISTQVGCKFSCAFCASGLSGFIRNLTSAEMIEEALWLKDKSLHNRLTHLVFMGSGEPLDNYDNVMEAVRIINSPHALNIGARRITISTSGVIGGIKKLADEGLQIELSVSLHSASDKIRSAIMPINKKYALAELIQACRDYVRKTNRQITFEYILLKDINSDLPSAIKLSKILKHLNCKVNLIPANPVKEFNIEPPNKIEVLSFRSQLLKSGINVTLRKPRGQDIDAACGQLRLKVQNDNDIYSEH